MINRVTKAADNVGIQHCIVSVADKEGCSEFIESLIEIIPEIRIYSTGGTYSLIKKVLAKDRAENLINMADFTGQPEMQGGLVKTLDFKIYTGLLSEPGNSEHLRHIESIGGVVFDMVVVNLYPFSDAVSSKEATPEDARSHIDIGGPCMLRAAAKNYLRVAGVCNPGDYGEILTELRRNGGALSLETRFNLAKKVFAHTGTYDRAIETYLNGLSVSDVETAYGI